MKSKKYRYLSVIQGNYGAYGWEDVSEYEHGTEDMKTLKSDLAEYQRCGYPIRMIQRRVAIRQEAIK